MKPVVHRSGTRASQIEFGLDEALHGYWGFSPSSNPAGGYREYGVDAIGLEPNGYTADVERLTLVDAGWDDPACYRPPSEPLDDYGEGVVTPHAALQPSLLPLMAFEEFGAGRIGP